MIYFKMFVLVVATFPLSAFAKIPDEVLARSANNRDEIVKAITQVPSEHREGLEFLIRYMPERDLQSLSEKFLLDNTRLAYLAWKSNPILESVPREIFLNNVLPYASINERRDDWRADFHKRFLPLISDAKTISEAATILNRNVFKEIGVKYSTKRAKSDQSPYESMESGLASCTGLSVLLIDACRAVGIPARFVGTPLWSDKSGNHSWVEIWDGAWHFTGAAEPTGDQLNQGWFLGRAALASRDDRMNAIYATSFKKTPLTFPCQWDRRIDYISAVNVTDRYVNLKKKLPPGMVEAMFVVRDQNLERVAVQLRVTANDELIFKGTTNDERFDANDHLRIPLKSNQKYLVEIDAGATRLSKVVTAKESLELVSFLLPEVAEKAEHSAPILSSPIDLLKKYLQTDASDRKILVDQPFAKQPLSKTQTETARKMLAEDRAKRLRVERAGEMESAVISLGQHKMPFAYKRFGEKPKDGYSLYISMHGGGGTQPAVNDRQWENQKSLYQLKEGIYVAPRAPTNTWNLWHRDHVDPLLCRLIENMSAFEDINVNRVYIMGYSAGGDGVYQLAPRMSDRWAAASMMAGHPNETSPLGLRNVPFSIQVGGKDARFRRNAIAEKWKAQLANLQNADPGGYKHFVKIYPEKGHWMDREDAIAIPWMAKHTRNPTPSKVVWKQDDVTHEQFYWLGVSKQNQKRGTEVIAEVKGQTIELIKSDIQEVIVYLDDRFIDLDSPVTIMLGNDLLHRSKPTRTIASLASTLNRSGDPNLSFPASITVSKGAVSKDAVSKDAVSKEKTFSQLMMNDENLTRYTAVRTHSPVKIDGLLDEPG